MLADGKHKRTRKNPNDPARFISQIAVTDKGEAADKKIYALDESKIADEARYDGLYALCTDLLDDDPKTIINVSDKVICRDWRMLIIKLNGNCSNVSL